jgi:hypothetical protein
LELRLWGMGRAGRRTRGASGRRDIGYCRGFTNCRGFLRLWDTAARGSCEALPRRGGGGDRLDEAKAAGGGADGPTDWSCTDEVLICPRYVYSAVVVSSRYYVCCFCYSGEERHMHAAQGKEACFG